MTPTTVINIRRAPAGWQNNPDFVYVGRPGRGFQGYFGNPLRTINGYWEWLHARINADPQYRAAVQSLQGKTLVCFCKPRECHGDYLAIFADALTAGLI